MRERKKCYNKSIEFKAERHSLLPNVQKNDFFLLKRETAAAAVGLILVNNFIF